MIDPKKLAALIARESEVKPFENPSMYDEGVPVEEDYMEGEPDEMEEEDELGLDEEITEEEIEAIADMIDEGKGIPELMDLADELAAAIEEEGKAMVNPPKWAKNKGLWNKLEKTIDPEGKGSKYSEPYAVVAHAYKKAGGSIG